MTSKKYCIFIVLRAEQPGFLSNHRISSALSRYSSGPVLGTASFQKQRDRWRWGIIMNARAWSMTWSMRTPKVFNNRGGRTLG